MTKEQKRFEAEILRISDLLKKKHQVNFVVVWSDKRKNNLISTKDIVQLKENGLCTLVGMVYFTIADKETILIGQTMLLLNERGKEISCTNFFIQSKKVIELSYAWDDGMRLLTISISDYINNPGKFLAERL